MSDRLPAGALDAFCGPLHQKLCYSAVTGDSSHSWRDHSGTGYPDFAHEVIASLNAAGLTIVRRKP